MDQQSPNEVDSNQKSQKRTTPLESILEYSTLAIIGIAIVTTATVAAINMYHSHNPNNNPDNKVAQPNQPSKNKQSSEDRLREVILSYMSDPDFTSSDFTRQITGTPAKLELFDVDEDMLYFSAPTPEIARKLSSNPLSIEFADRNRVLGKYTFNSTGEIFRFPARYFHYNPKTTLLFPVGRTTYTISLPELADFLENNSIYGGRAEFITSQTGSKVITTANHGAYVARRGEPSLTRLVNQVTQGATTKEQKAQRLLDLVTSLKYNFKEAYSDLETMKRPNEVIMSGGSDCSGLTIAYASLLEQTEINYQLLYMDGHIAVAVEGDFPNWNRLSSKLSDKSPSYSYTATTSPGFRIGESLINRKLSDIQYTQQPSKGIIMDVRTGKEVAFW